MNNHDTVADGYSIRLTGDHVWFIRASLGESQAQLAKRLAVTQPVIHRMERKGPQEITGPEIIILNTLAKQYGIDVPAHPDRSVTPPLISQEAPIE